MLQAGLAAERGLAIWRQRTAGGPPPTKCLETMSAMRDDLFGKDDYRHTPGFGRSLLSELRAFGDVPVGLVARGNARVLAWVAPDSRGMTITLASAYPIEIEAGKNVTELEVSQGLGFTILRFKPKDAGPCEAGIKLPAWAAHLPAWQAPYRFEEILR